MTRILKTAGIALVAVFVANQIPAVRRVLSGEMALFQ